MKKDSIYSPNCKNKFSFVNTKPSLNQNEVKTTYRPHTHQHIMNKKAEREKNHLVLNLGCDWWGNNYLFYHQRRHSVRSHVINVVVSIVQVCTGSTWWKRTQSIKNKFSFVNTKPSLNQNEVETSHRPAQSWVKSSRTIQRLGLGGDKIICLPPKAAFYSILYCMHGQRDEKGIMSTPKRKKHHVAVGSSSGNRSRK